MNKPIYMDRGEFRKEHKDIVGLLNKTSSVLRNEAIAQSKEARMRLGKGVKTRGGRVVSRGRNVMGSGFIADEIAHGLWNAGKKAVEFSKQEEARKAEKAEAFKKRMAEIDRNNPFQRNEELAKQLGYGFFDDIRGGLESAANWADDNINPLAAIARRLGGDIQSATRFGRGKGSSSNRPPNPMNTHRRMILEGRGTTGLRAGEEIGDMFARMRREDQEAKKKVQDAKDSKVAEAQRKIDEYRKEMFGFGFDVYEPTASNDISGWIEKERRDTGYYGRPAILGEGM